MTTPIDVKALETKVMSALRNPDVPLNCVEASIAATWGCARCLAAEHPYWHPKEQPCPVPATGGAR